MGSYRNGCSFRNWVGALARTHYSDYEISNPEKNKKALRNIRPSRESHVGSPGESEKLKSRPARLKQKISFVPKA
jgi:hypothetical protein